MPTNTYTDEFRRRAVELYESTPDTTFQAIANDLGISRGALKTWVTKYGSGQIRATASCEDRAFRGRESCAQG